MGHLPGEGLPAFPNPYMRQQSSMAQAFSISSHITWPMLYPTTFFLLVTGIVNSFAVFEQVNIMTNGGPFKQNNDDRPSNIQERFSGVLKWDMRVPWRFCSWCFL